jgi:hypothetical protein
MRFQSIVIAVIISLGLFSTGCKKTLCDNTCPYANDGVCDDGGDKSVNHVCQLGTDCSDCGDREN